MFDINATRKSFTTSDGVKLRYLEAGTGQPFVMIPGWSQTADQWHSQINHFSKSYRVLALDMRGHGESDKPAHGYRIYRLSKDVREFIEELDLTNAILMGHSMGCSVLWGLYDLYGADRVSKFVFVDEPPSLSNNATLTPDGLVQAGAIFTPEATFGTVVALAGDAEFFAVLYCHGMASIAVAEALAMSGDEALRPVLERAVRYSLAMQSPATGGWRYAAGDKGDTSQLGWQLMLLSSARTAGLGGFESAEAGARSFLHAVSSGRAGGLAAYRPGERPGAAMTAEALFCRMLLGMPADHPAVAEGIEFLAHTPPDPRHPNAYAWYYSTLASFHVGGPQWEGWNHRLQAALLPLQRRESSGLDGSWDPDPVWGGHGGRVYATALAAMTLEVYYRHLPMHRRATATAAAAGRLGR